MARIIFLNRYFYPDHSATSQILSDLAFHLAAAGQDIHVVTSQQIYDDPAARLPPNEVIRGVQVHRVATTRFGRSNLIGRGLDYLSFYWSMWRRLISFAKSRRHPRGQDGPPVALGAGNIRGQTTFSASRQLGAGSLSRNRH